MVVVFSLFLCWLASSLLCAYFVMKTPLAPSYISSVSTAQGETEFSFLIWIVKSKGRILIRPAVSYAHPIMKDGGEGCPWQLVHREDCKDLECQGIVSQGDWAKPQCFSTVSSGSSTSCCGSLEGGLFLIDRLLQNCYNRCRNSLFTELFLRSIHRSRDFFFLNDSTALSCLRWQRWVLLKIKALLLSGLADQYKITSYSFIQSTSNLKVFNSQTKFIKKSPFFPFLRIKSSRQRSLGNSLCLYLLSCPPRWESQTEL